MGRTPTQSLHTHASNIMPRFSDDEPIVGTLNAALPRTHGPANTVVCHATIADQPGLTVAGSGSGCIDQR
jgi:hypothetical protein